MYFILEVQTFDNGSSAIVTPIHSAETRNEADSVYHSILAVAAISTLPKHAAMIITSAGTCVANTCYTHEADSAEIAK